jgi:hypothetical protein
LSRELERRALTSEEQNELRERIGLSEAQTALGVDCLSGSINAAKWIPILQGEIP